MPQITQGNRLYLYQLLSRELGVGKQTKIELAEEVLVADDVLPSDLDCTDIRELMEALVDIVRVTVFKRGRVYVTVLANPEFDGYLQAPAEEHAPQQRKAQGRKSWKQKRAPKIPKPAKPKPKRRPQETEEAMAVEEAGGVASTGPVALDAATMPKTLEEPAQTTVPGQEQPEAQRMSGQAETKAPDTAAASPTGAAPMASAAPVTSPDSVEEPSGHAGCISAQANGRPKTAAATSDESADEGSATVPGGTDTVTTSGAREESSSESLAEVAPEAGKAKEQLVPAEETSTDTAALTSLQESANRVIAGQTTPAAGPTSEAAGDKTAETKAAPAEKDDAPDVPGQAAPSLDASSPAIEEPSPTTDAPSEPNVTSAFATDKEPLFFAGTHTSIRLVSMPAEEPESTPSRVRIFPDSFAHEVRMDNEPLATLYSILPFDVDPIALLDEDWHFSESIESYTYEDARLRFPLRYLRSNDEPVEVTLKRVAPGTSGKRWLLEDVAVGDEVGLWGLPVADEGAWSHLSDAWRRPHMLVSPRRELARFAHLGQTQTLLESLADAAEDEWWGHDYAILSDYLAITFWRARHQGKIAVSLDGRHAALDTGLVSADGCPVLMHFEERSGKVPWTFDHFGTDNQGLAPEPPTYVSELSHITLVADAGVRLSREVVRSHGDTITTHVEQSVRYAVRNHRVATPAFDPQTDEMRLLVPIRDDAGEVFALVLAPDTLTGYIALSVMSREAAYACARAVSAEQPSWLRPA